MKNLFVPLLALVLNERQRREKIQCYTVSSRCFICASKDSAYIIHYFINSPEIFADSHKTLIYFRKSLEEIDESLAEVNKTLGEVNMTHVEVNKTLGEVNETSAEVDKTLVEVIKSLAEVVGTLIYSPKTFNYAKQSIINK